MHFTDEQLDAINKDHSNIIVSAGAGSGKTAVLSERVIRKLKEGVHINQLLILTFTNNAAKEMKDRIKKKIKKEGLIDELNLIDSAYITTFDSYSLSILKKYHYKLNISKNINIIDADIVNYKKEQIIDNIFNKYYENKDEKFLKLINDFCEKDDKDIKNYILNISSKLDLLTDLDSYLNNYIDTYYNDEFINKALDNYTNLLINKINNIKILNENLSYYVDNKYMEKLELVLNNLFNSKTYIDIKSNINISLPRLMKANDIAKNYKDEIKKELDELKKLCRYISLDDAKKEIISTKDYIIIILDIIKELNKELFDFKFKNDMYEFNDVAKLSIKLLKENKDIRDEIKYSLNEIMIDEYQDTSDLQEEFISLISNNNTYMVGDIKQSIYKFRNANPYIFKNKYDNYSKNNGGIKIDLNKNFRSREEVLNNINILFDLIMDSTIGGADYKISHQMIFGNNIYNTNGKNNQNNNFEIYNYDYDKTKGFTKEETEIFIIANDIKNKINNNYKVLDKNTNELRNATYSDFVILIDKSKSFDLFKKIFEYLSIPATINADEKINDKEILIIIKNFFICLDKINNHKFDNEFKHSFVSILRSFIFNYSDEEIFDLFLNNNFYNDKIYKELKNININNKTSKEIYIILLNKFNIIDKLSRIGNIKNNIATLEYIYTYFDSKENIGMTPSVIASYLDDILDKGEEIKITNNNDDNNSVKIMTIHKSKGLEYSICYYACLFDKFNIKDINSLFIYDKQYGIISPYYNNGIGETIYKDLIKDNFIKEEISEKIRLFYVALTRAKEKMILVCDMNGENYSNKNDGVIDNLIRLKYRSFQDILVSLKQYLEKYITNIDNIYMTKDYEIIKNYNFRKYIDKSNIKLNIKELEKDNNTITSNRFSKNINRLYTKEEINNMNYGTKMHYIFEISDFKNSKEDIITKFNSKYDSSKSINIYKEYEFMYFKNNSINHGIIDLLIEYEDYIDIIDYKTSNIEDDAYIKQLKGYKEFIENKTNKNTNIYLYSIRSDILKKI